LVYRIFVLVYCNCFEIPDLAGGVLKIVLVLNRDISRQFSLCTLLDV